jgi:hypothetical protein
MHQEMLICRVSLRLHTVTDFDLRARVPRATHRQAAIMLKPPLHKRIGFHYAPIRIGCYAWRNA